jgi:hypothetical protein
MPTNSINLDEAGVGTVAIVRRGRFFQVTAVCLLVAVVMGFARTLLLRAWYPVPLIPAYIEIHGLVMVSWYVLLVIQTSLVATHRADLHRRLGVFGAVLSAFVVAADLNMVLRYPGHFTRSSQIGTDGLPQPPLETAIGFFWGDLAGVVVFAVLVAIALRLRRGNFEVHKRLMLLASIDLIGPALGRFGDIPRLWNTDLPSQGLLTLSTVALMGLPLIVVLHDLFTPRRFYMASILGALGCVGSAIVVPALLPGTFIWHSLWNALK